MPITGYDRVKTFFASRNEDRAALGDKVTAWLAEHPQLEVVHTVVRQTSDRSHHGFGVVLFLKERK